MGKYSDFDRIEADKYYTRDPKGVAPLLKFLPPKTKFCEPMAGAAHLINHLEGAGHECVGAFDILPEAPGITQADVLFFGFKLPPCDLIITNPIWEREPLHEAIRVFVEQADTWLLFDADWAHTIQASPFENICRKIVPCGRVNWIPGTTDGGKQNCCWYLFSKDDSHGPCRSYFRQ